MGRMGTYSSVSKIWRISSSINHSLSCGAKSKVRCLLNGFHFANLTRIGQLTGRTPEKYPGADTPETTPGWDCSGAFLFVQVGYGAVAEIWLEAGLSIPALL